MRMQRTYIAIVLAGLIAVLSGFARAQLATPQAPPPVQKLVIMTGEPIQFHIKGNGQVWPGQVVRVHTDGRVADLIVWDGDKRAWAEHHRIALDAGDVYYTLFR